MTEQPEALRLADQMLHYWDERGPDAEEVAAELRRLHAENEMFKVMHQSHADKLKSVGAINVQLLEALEECVEDSQSAVDQYVLAYGENFRPHRLKGLREIVSKARAAIAAAKDSNVA